MTMQIRAATAPSLRVPRIERRLIVRRSVASAPMRVSFAGGGSDVPPFATGLGGRVVGTAIDLRVRVVVEPFDRGWIRLDAPATGRTVTRRSTDPARSELDFRLIEAALAQVGVDDGARVEVDTSILPGAGLGGSSAAAVAALSALEASIGEASRPELLVEDATAIERQGLGNLCGSQDQLLAAYGGSLDLRFDDRGQVRRRPLLAPAELVLELEGGLLLVDTLVRRVSGHVLEGIGRRSFAATAELVWAAGDVSRGFAAGSLDRVLAGMRRSALAKVLHDPRGNQIAIDLARRLVPLGAELVRTCGAGGGGHVLVWAPPGRHWAIEAALPPSWIVRRPAIGAPGVRLEA
jgi:D-glycero-alpha-D-manno-heptose-7-phosphate kinase